MIDNIEYTINHGLSYETANYLQNMGDGRLMPVPVRAIALDFPRFAIMHDHAATGDRIEYNGLEYQVVGPVRRYLGWAIFQVKQAMARGAAWVPNFTPGAPRARDIVQRVGGVVLLDAPGNSIGPGVTFSRADQAMVCDEQGNWTLTALPYRRSYDVQTKEWGYLFEPQRTNLCHSITPAPNNLTVVAGELKGGLQSYVLKPTAASGIHRINFQGVSGVGGTAYTTSVFVESLGTRYVYLNGWGRQNSGQVVFDLVDGTFKAGSSTEGVMSNIGSERYGSGWRLRFTATPNSDGTGLQYLQLNDTFVASDTSYMGDPSTQGVRIWGFQLETGSIATSPIATNGAAKTVAADVCTYQNNVLTDAAGTVLARYNNKSASWTRILSSTSYIQMAPTPTTLEINDGTSMGVSTTNPTTGVVSWGVDGASVIANGTQEATRTYANPVGFTLPVMSIGRAGGSDFVAAINHLSVFPTQLDAATRQLMLSVVQ